MGAENTPPVAQCKDMTVAADGSCQANASVDNGSYDPDGDTVTLEQSPAGPYALGDTAVTLTVTDGKGGTNTCSTNASGQCSVQINSNTVGANTVKAAVDAQVSTEVIHRETDSTHGSSGPASSCRTCQFSSRSCWAASSV